MGEDMQSIELEVSLGMAAELISRAASMGLTASEYMGCVLGQHMESNAALEYSS